MTIMIINGANLNLLGKRETEIYGGQTFEEYLKKLKELYPTVDFNYFQSNVEGEIVNEIQIAGGFGYVGIILNAGGYSHTSVVIADAIAAITTPVIEVHISNIFGREDFRKLSHVSGKAKGIISGLGLKGYELALESFIK